MLATRTKQRGVGEAIQWLAEFPERKAFHERTNHLHTSRQRFTRKRTAFRAHAPYGTTVQRTVAGGAPCASISKQTKPRAWVRARPKRLTARPCPKPAYAGAACSPGRKPAAPEMAAQTHGAARIGPLRAHHVGRGNRYRIKQAARYHRPLRQRRRLHRLRHKR